MYLQARHTTYGIRKCFLFLLQCQLALVIIQVRKKQTCMLFTGNKMNRIHICALDVLVL